MMQADNQPKQKSIALRTICDDYNKQLLDSGISLGSIIDVAHTKRSDNSVAIIDSKEIQLFTFTDTHEHMIKIVNINELGWTDDSLEKIMCPNEQRIVVTTTNKVAIFDLDADAKKYLLTSSLTFDSPFVSVACSATKNLFLCALKDGNIVLWNFETPENEKFSLKLYDKHESYDRGTSVRFLSDIEFIYSIADHHKIHNIQLIDGTLQEAWCYHDKGRLRLQFPECIAIMPDCIVAPAEDGRDLRKRSLVTLDLKDGRVTKSIKLDTEVTAIAPYSKTELIATNGIDGLSIIDLEKQAITWSYVAPKFVGHYHQTQINLLSPKYVLTTDTVVANIWEIGSKKQPEQISFTINGKHNQEKLFLALSRGKIFMLDDGVFIGTVNKLAEEIQKYIELKRLAKQEEYPEEIIPLIAYYAFFKTSYEKPVSINNGRTLSNIIFRNIDFSNIDFSASFNYKSRTDGFKR